MSFQHDRFDQVDQAPSADPFITFLDRIDRVPDVRERRRRSYDLLRFGSGQRVADIGSGIGTVCRELADLGAETVGIDASEAMISAARSRHPDLDFRVATAESLPFADGELAGYRAERLYQHIGDPRPALAEAHRALAARGRIVLIDQDWDGFLIDADDRATTRAIRESYTDSFRNGSVGRQYRRHLLEAGFEDVAIEIDGRVLTDFGLFGPLLRDIVNKSVEARAVTAEAGEGWLADQEGRAAEGQFLALMTHVLAAATRPA